MKYLAVVDADRIHEYVFSPHELKMIRGGSQLQRKLNRELAPQRLNHQATLISANGGTVLAEFPDEASARAYCREVGELYRSETEVATVSWAVAPLKGSFAAARREVLNRLERNKRACGVTQFEGGNPFWLTCQSCGMYPGTERQREGEEWRGICRGCRLRWDSRDRIPDPRGYALAEDFEELGKLSSPENYLAIAYIDVDQLGRFLDRDDLSQTECRRLSAEVEEAVENSMWRACRGLRVKERERGKEKKKVWVAPYEVLLSGGDDAIVALPANHVLRFLTAFEAEYGESDLMKNPGAPTFSVGVAIAHSHFPIGEFVRVASAYCGRRGR